MKLGNGYGELWRGMAASIGEHVLYKKRIAGIDSECREVEADEGSVYAAKKIIITIPWKEYREIAGIPTEIYSGIKALKYMSTRVDYEKVERILSYGSKKGIYGLGRRGEHSHYK